MKIKILSIILLIINTFQGKAQIFDHEQANSNIKWKQINTEKFQLIFPEQFTPSANKLAHTIDIQLNQANGNLVRKARKISIVIQENTLEQNGFVQLAPRKSEYYSTPSGIADNQSWLTNLSVHELRHVAQFDNLTGNLRKPYGQQLALALFSLNLPSWYFEGDAVLHETLYSAGGRGRLSSWQMPIRANIQSNVNFNFNKYTHGSFKDIVPSYYTIGYFMNSELYEKDILNTSNIYTNMRGKLLRPFNFQRALKKYYGHNSNTLFKQTIANLAQIWEVKTENIYPNRIDAKDKYPTDYILPQVNGVHIYALQQGPQRTSRIISIDNNTLATPKEIVKTGIQLMPYFDSKGDIIVWDEVRRNARFSKETFNVINTYNTKTKQKKTITYETRYYTPTLSPDLQHIACVEVDEANNSYLTIVDTYHGTKIKSIKSPIGIHIQQPQYHSSGEKIVAIGVSENGTTLVEIDLKNEKLELLLPWGNQQIERPIYYDDTIFFKTNIDNKDDIFSLNKGQIVRITDTQFGAFNPYVHQNKVYFNDYTLKGLKINHLTLNDSTAQTVRIDKIKTLYPNQNTFQIPAVATNGDTTYSISKYNTIAHAINFHSISLSGSDFESFDNLKPGIFILSNDVLNTTQTKIGYEYDTDIRKSIYSAQISYQKYYPKLTIGYKNRGQIASASVPNKPDSTLNFDYRESLISADIQLPFVKYRGNKVYSYGINVGTSYQHRYNTSISLSNFNTDIKLPLNYQFYFNKNSLRSRMDIFPRWGQNFNFIYRHLPFEQELKGSSWSFRANLYFPGFVINHGIQLRYSMQENTGRFTSTNDIPLFSGIAYIPYKTIKNTLLIDYRLPLSYPDWSLGQLAYLRRIYASVAANYLNIQESSATPQAISGSLFFDFRLFKYTLPNFVLETKASYITVNNARKKIFPELSLSYNY